MLTNKFEQSGVVRELDVNNNEVKILTYSSEKCNKNSEDLGSTTFSAIYTKCSTFEAGGRKLLEIITETEKIIISFDLCRKIVSVPCSAQTKYYYVAGEIFVRVANGTKQYIYDELGNMIDSDEECELNVKFGGCQPVITKKNRKTKKFYQTTIEGYAC